MSLGGTEGMQQLKALPEPEPEPEPRPRRPPPQLPPSPTVSLSHSPSPRRAARSPSRIKRVSRARERARGKRSPVAGDGNIHDDIALTRARLAGRAGEAQDLELAATRIQAAYRGRQGRRQTDATIEAEWHRLRQPEEDAEGDAAVVRLLAQPLPAEPQLDERTELGSSERASPVSLNPRRQLAARERRRRMDLQKTSSSPTRERALSPMWDGAVDDQEPTSTDIFSRLADPAHFTGSHRHRFDEHGNGRGLAGRDVVPKGAGHGSILSLQDGVVSMDLSAILRPELQGGSGRFGSQPSLPPGQRGSRSLTGRLYVSGAESPSSLSPQRAKHTTASKEWREDTVFDKLTDSAQYTGAHRHRFDKDGRGKGKLGRDRVLKGHGTDNVTLTYDASDGKVGHLGQILRTDIEQTDVEDAKRSAKVLRQARKDLNDAVALAAWQAQRQAARQEAEKKVVSLRQELSGQEGRLDALQVRSCSRPIHRYTRQVVQHVLERCAFLL